MVEIVLTVHLLIVLFCVVGFPVGLVWNLRLLRYLHAVILGFVSLFMVIGVSCPLTVLEEKLREGSYEGSFIATWVNRIIYLEWEGQALVDPVHVLVADLLFATLVFSSFYWYPVNRGK